jgi:hypothetical protein
MFAQGLPHTLAVAIFNVLSAMAIFNLLLLLLPLLGLCCSSREVCTQQMIAGSLAIEDPLQILSARGGPVIL